MCANLQQIRSAGYRPSALARTKKLFRALALASGPAARNRTKEACSLLDY